MFVTISRNSQDALMKCNKNVNNKTRTSIHNVDWIKKTHLFDNCQFFNGFKTFGMAESRSYRAYSLKN